MALGILVRTITMLSTTASTFAAFAFTMMVGTGGTENFLHLTVIEILGKFLLELAFHLVDLFLVLAVGLGEFLRLSLVKIELVAEVLDLELRLLVLR